MQQPCASRRVRLMVGVEPSMQRPCVSDHAGSDVQTGVEVRHPLLHGLRDASRIQRDRTNSTITTPRGVRTHFPSTLELRCYQASLRGSRFGLSQWKVGQGVYEGQETNKVKELDDPTGESKNTVEVELTRRPLVDVRMASGVRLEGAPRLRGRKKEIGTLEVCLKLV
ncbi:unnamed protein product [Hydatigera taeniaeformis]|uniref:Uncharacterized protein n=1 Tax=Hydatigena taeniaeformis TaxID=6205 RepID=A0A0R3WTR6_HYDTA|nr:unnamed protein product [Hydatigera taeniaeformis]